LAKQSAKLATISASGLAGAIASYYEAEYLRCLEIVAQLLPAASGEQQFELLLLRTRALYRLPDLTAARLAAADVCDKASSPSNLVLANVWRGVTLRADGKVRESVSAFARASDSLEKASVSARSEYAYYAAMTYWEDGDLARAEGLIEEHLSNATGIMLGMLTQLLGWIEVRRERYAAAADFFLEALDVFEAAPQTDVRFTARLVHGLSVIASETIDLRLALSYDDKQAAMRWSRGVARQHFHTLTCRLFLALLQGNLEGAWRLSLDAIWTAPTEAFKAFAETNAAVVSGLVGDKFATRAHFATAWQIIESISWSKADEEERIALTNFAIEAAAVMPSEARSAVTRYRNITGSPDSRLALNSDRRMQAFEAMAAGRVSEALGKPKDAIANYERSRQIWVALDYRMRAALVARDLHRLTKDEMYLHDVRVALSRAPHAWFGERLERDKGETLLNRLTPAERTVLKHLLGGESAVSIAQRLGRSTYTIHNHTRKIFDVFEVRTRAALLARCADEGVTADKVA
jgi:DNA-binding CsgD family transcriptional regulator/tetratricopeptide (TPR) repeat protein